MKKVTKAVIPAAGHGTRFLPVTKAVPKEMLAIVDKPAAQYIAEEAAAAGITQILFVVSEGKEAIRRYFTPAEFFRGVDARDCDELDKLLSAVEFSFVEQKVLDGTGSAVALARDFTGDDPFAVIYGDDVVINPGKPCIGQLIDAYYRTQKTILGVQECPPEEAVKYAVVEKGGVDGRLTEVLGLYEKPSPENMPSTLCSLGRYVLTPDVYDAIERAPLFRGERYLTSAIALLAAEKGVYAYEFEGKRYDLGDKLGFLKANVDLGIARFGKSFADFLALK